MSMNSAFRAPPARPSPPPRSAGTPPEVSPERLRATSRNIKAGIWVCAAITMTASVVNGTSVFDILTTGVLGVAVGFITALGVDAALVVVLTGDSKMQELGIPAAWGRIMRWGTLLMSLALNCGASILENDWFLAGLHAVPPLLLCGLAEYGQEVGNTFSKKIRAQAEFEAAENRAAAEREENERIAQQRRDDDLRKSDNDRIAAEAYARVRPAELEAEKQKRDAEQRDKDRELAEREQIRAHASELARTAVLARWLQAYVLAGKLHHGGGGADSRNGSPASVTSPSPGAHQAGSPGAHQPRSPARHQVRSPASPGESPGAPPAPHQPAARVPRTTPAPGTTGSSSQVAPEIGLMADLAELWLAKNPGAGRTRLVKHLTNQVNNPGDQPGEPLVTNLVNDLVKHLVTRPGEQPGDRITDHTGKLVQKELGRREKEREIAHLEQLLHE